MNTSYRHLEVALSFFRLLAIASITATVLIACQATKPPVLSGGHLQNSQLNETRNDHIPAPVKQSPWVPLPTPQAKQETYTVVVSDVPIKELLFSLARDAKINVDIDPKISGNVTVNAVNQTLTQILERISKQVDIRYAFSEGNLTISPDQPFWQSYRINYVNMNRKSQSEVSVATQIATTGGSVSKGSQSNNASNEGNSSKTKVTNASDNDFWKTIVANLRTIVGETAGTTGGESSLVIANPTSGIVNVKATQKQHHQIGHFVEQVMANAQRQVLIEMTIVEVELSNRYQAGIDWQRLSSSLGTGGNGLSFIAKPIGANLAVPPVFSIGYNNTLSNGSNIGGTMKMLESFGNVKVLSSPKLMALNNQTALLKVVDEKVYFTVEMQVEAATTTTAERRTYTSAIHTVPVGLVMNVVPQINKDGYVSLNIRPTITRITGFATDPAPTLMGQTFSNLIPEIQIREMESLLQVADKQTIVMGGLMQNRLDLSNKEVPGVGKVKLLRDLLSYKDHNFTKTELVIFLRPTIVNSSGSNTNMEQYRQYLPGSTNSIFSDKSQKSNPPTP